MNRPSPTGQRQDVLKRALIEIRDLRSQVEAGRRTQTEPIAIIGLGCRFPGGADTPETFWQFLRNGTDGTREIPADRWNVDAYYNADPNAPGKMYTRRGGFLDDVSAFDPLFFNIPPREAISMDPQHRLFLEVSWEALEDAGLAPNKLVGSRLGVFLGITANDYTQLSLQHLDPGSIDAYTSLGSPFNFATGRLSYLLGAHGPSLAVDTACSSSLVSVHLACQNLRLGACDLAVAGGVNLMLLPETMVALSKAKMLAADGRCKTFDAAADGYGRGEGCGVVVLKRLSDAVADGDRILALIRSSAVNQDGPSSGLTVPNGLAQQKLIREALDKASFTPAQVSYVEAHGTGTSLGDPIEVRALAAVLAEGRPADQPLIVGSLKTNIGHLESAAGIAGLIKVVLSLQHGEIPAHLHLQNPNPYIPWAELPVKVPTERTSWPAYAERRIAGISSFGVSGTNAHIILEEAPKPEARAAGPERPLHLLALSAKSETALHDLAQRYANYLDVNSEASLPDICYTANTGRNHFDYRLAVSASSPAQMRQALAAVEPKKVSGKNRLKVAFLFTGQGSQYVGMGRELYQTQPTFRQTLEHCDEILRRYQEQPLLSVLYGETDSQLLDQTAYTQPALFALEYALARLWQSWGIEPSAVMGHSVGEYVAACLAGVFSLEDGLKLIAERGHLMQALPEEGAMAALFADEQRALQAIAPYREAVSIAAINGPEETVISGQQEAVARILAEVEAQGIKTQRLLKISHAFHSPLMEPILETFTQTAAQVKWQRPQLKLISNLTGQLAPPDEITGPTYWRRHLRESVQFKSGMQTLYDLGYRVFVELGPRPTLLGMGRRCLQDDEALWLPSLRPGQSDWQQMLNSLGQLYTRGAEVNWLGFDQDYARRKVSLPTYPFQRQRYWFPVGEKNKFAKTIPAPQAVGSRHPLLGRRLPSPLKHIQFESQFGLDSLQLIREHRLYGMAVMPGIVYIQMAFAALSERFDEAQTFSLEQFSVLQPFVLEEDDWRTVHLILTPEDSGSAAFEVFRQDASAESADESWTLLVKGRVSIGAEDKQPSIPEPVSIAEIQARCPDQFSGSEFYTQIWRPEFQLGSSFQCLTQLWRRDGEALGQIQMPEPSPDLAVRPEILVLDASVQLLLAALPPAAREGTPKSGVFVGQGQQFTHVYRPFPHGPIWCQVRLRNSDFAETVSGDIYLFDETGQVFAEFGDVRYGRLSQTMLQRVARRQERLTPKFSPTREALLTAMPDQRYRLVETYLRETVGQVLGLSSAQLDEAQALVMMLDSLMAVELKQRIEGSLEIEVPLARLLGGDSLAEMAVFLSNQLAPLAHPLPDPGQSARGASHLPRELRGVQRSRRDAGLEQNELVTKMTVEELLAEAVLAADIQPEGAPVEQGAEPRNILLTGATGFIGAFLLDELLRQTSATLYCLVRAPDDASAKSRIKRNLESYFLWDDALDARVIPVVGDLAQPRLGLSAEQFSFMTRETDVIWHCGALVKWTYPYQALKAPNVLGTEEILRLACQHRTKPVHFISTVGVFSSPDYAPEVVRESDPLESSGPLHVGYAQSKWVAEKLVRLAGERGLPVTIYRPNTGGHSRTGVFNPNDHLPLLIKGCVQLGYLPEDLGLTVQSAPIDYVSQAMVYLAGQPASVGQTFHLVNPSPLPWPEVVERIRGLGYLLPTLPYSQWAAELADQIQRSNENMTEDGGPLRATEDRFARRMTNHNALYALSPFLSDSAIDNNRLPVFDCKNVLKAVAGTSLNCPPLDELLQVYFTQFVSSGFLNAPNPIVLSPSY